MLGKQTHGRLTDDVAVRTLDVRQRQSQASRMEAQPKIPVHIEPARSKAKHWQERRLQVVMAPAERLQVVTIMCITYYLPTAFSHEIDHTPSPAISPSSTTQRGF